MSALKDIQNGELRKALGNFCLSKITLAINAAAAATVKSTGAINYAIDGVQYTKAALAAQSIAITHDCFGNAVGGNNLSEYTQPAGVTAYYLVCLNAAGTVAVVQGNYNGQALAFPNDLSKVLTGDGSIPKEPDGYVAVGMFKVATANAATFDPATTALDAADVTVTYYDLARIPATAP
jgi:hypothetical protein